MRLSAAADDAAGFGKEAHAIKGGCAMLGAGEMAKIAEEMESLGTSRWSRVPRRADRRSRDRSVRIVHLTDAEAMEAALMENLQRRDVHPLEEAQGSMRC
jgi:ParB family chromosome partitioning protein